MYLTGGQFKGYKVEVPKSAKPTLSKVRESIFNILYSLDICEGYFLDMFSGSGIIALEAVSRGYSADALEINKQSFNLIKKNIEKISVKPNVILCDALKYKTEKKYNIIYIDPPWQDNYLEAIKKAVSLLSENGIVIIEHDSISNIDFKLLIENFEIPLKPVKSKKYGRCLIDIFVFVKKC